MLFHGQIHYNHLTFCKYIITYFAESMFIVKVYLVLNF
nr:MAG TPA: hypothetical protein [Caudoviricetes sp.]